MSSDPESNDICDCGCEKSAITGKILYPPEWFHKHQKRPILDLVDLHTAALLNESVIGPTHTGYQHPKPAKWVFNMTGPVILGLITRGLYVYKP